jgi:hypothetical protein
MSDGAAPPPQPTGEDPLDRALADTQRTRPVVVASVTAASNGGLLLMQTMQLYYFLHLEGAYQLVPPVLLVLGVALLVLASKLYSQRPWAAVAALVVSAVAAAVMGIWCILMFMSGLLPLLTELLPFALAVGAVVAALAIGPCRRTAAARRRAAAAGLDIDL